MLLLKELMYDDTVTLNKWGEKYSRAGYYKWGNGCNVDKYKEMCIMCKDVIRIF